MYNVGDRKKDNDGFGWHHSLTCSNGHLPSLNRITFDLPWIYQIQSWLSFLEAECLKTFTLKNREGLKLDMLWIPRQRASAPEALKPWNLWQGTHYFRYFSVYAIIWDFSLFFFLLSLPFILLNSLLSTSPSSLLKLLKKKTVVPPMQTSPLKSRYDSVMCPTSLSSFEHQPSNTHHSRRLGQGFYEPGYPW